ncbi:MaoC family dehydratase [Pseudactinotalea sp. HY160]|uniref:MaoC family dehydratase n=1 Tax=Pseudactinotalea sp. HY160 TaxID=2654490 RepID=UPI00351AFB16
MDTNGRTGTPGTGGASDTVLPALPSLASLYGGALGRSARAAMLRTDRPQLLPNVVYRVDDVGVDPARLTRYQHLVGESGRDVLPAGFVHVLGFPLAVQVMARHDFPLPLLGMVHIANRVEVARPLDLTDALTVRAWSRNRRPHHRGTQVDLVVEVTETGDTDPQPAWRGVSTYLAKGVRLEGLEAAPEPVRQAPGELPVTARWELGAGVGREYARVSGDVNPIHLSSLSAKAFGFPRAIAHGMYTASRALALVGPRRGESFAWTTEFAAPVLLPGRVEVNVTETPDGFTYAGWGRKPNFTGAVHRLRPH